MRDERYPVMQLTDEQRRANVRSITLTDTQTEEVARWCRRRRALYEIPVRAEGRGIHLDDDTLYTLADELAAYEDRNISYLENIDALFHQHGLIPDPAARRLAPSVETRKPGLFERLHNSAGKSGKFNEVPQLQEPTEPQDEVPEDGGRPDQAEHNE